MKYQIPVVAALAWLELSIGKMRMFLRVVVVAGLTIGLTGIGWFVFTGSDEKVTLYNNLLATAILSVLVIVVAVPKLSARYLDLPDRGVLAAGSLVFAVEGLYVNLVRPLHLRLPPVVDSLAFACFLFSFGYVAVRIAMANERRLLSIENELEVARQVQRSILPTDIPEVQNVRIAAVYESMTAVAGDFYEFVPVNRHRVGLLVADVSGHGVPAALIAAMIKTAMQSVAPCAHDPREVLRGLDRILSGQLRGQFVSAAYLWLDTKMHRALYSAAGHPPLLRWRQGELERIESNGLLFGVVPGSDYPVWEMSLDPGDRFLLYTDGVTEPENAKGDAFGDYRREEVVRDNPARTPDELSRRLLREIRDWQPASASQQDDITLLVVDVV
jgi:sigma-B regulation protein RsbU (phosphoserine phosphatase)